MQKVFVGIIVSLLTFSVKASVIYESATGVFDTTTCCGSFVNSDQYIGAVFSLESETNINAIGGHFLNFAGMGGSIFGALVNLNSEGLPSGTPFTLDSIIAYTVFTPTAGSDSLTSISATLERGDYGIIFGSGLFGATGNQALTLLQSVASSSDGKTIATNPERDWAVEHSMNWNRYRIIVSGEQVSIAVPEPSSVFLLVMGAFCLLGSRHLQKNR